MKTLHITSSINSNYGGLPISCADITTSESQNHETHLISLDGIDYNSVTYKKIDSSDISLVDISSVDNKKQELRKIFNNVQPDVVCVWFPQSIFQIKDFLADLDKPVMLRASTIYNFDDMLPKTKEQYQAFFNMAKMPNVAVICNSEETKDWNKEFWGVKPEKQKVIVEGVDILNSYLPSVEDKNQAKQDFGINEANYVISNVLRLSTTTGDFNARKDPLGFIMICSQLSKKHKNLSFVLCGEGAKWSDSLVKRCIAAANKITGGCLSEKNFKALGHIEDPSKVYKASDIHFSTAVSEGFGRTIPEAMSYGVPSIVTQAGMMPEMNGDIACVIPTRKFGTSSESEYMGNLSSNLEWLKAVESQFEKLYSRNNQQCQNDSEYLIKRANEHYNAANVADRYVDFYKEFTSEITIKSEPSLLVTGHVPIMQIGVFHSSSNYL